MKSVWKLALLYSLAALPAWAEEPTLLPEVKVLAGDRGRVDNSVAPDRLGSEQVGGPEVTDINQVLRQAPGVYVREEEGLGLRPNIGLRGTNPDRSKKVVLLEDGVLAGPSPYTAPAAYYTPSMLTTHSLDIYKGFAAVPYGPNSIGGAINYLTAPIPVSKTLNLSGTYASFATSSLQAETGNILSWGGYYLKAARLSSAGFKELDTGDSTGFYRNDLLAKLRWNLPIASGRTHFIEARVGFGNEESDETYLGLTLTDFNENPYRRYAGSHLDQMQWHRSKVHLTHAYQLSETSVLTTDLYRLRFDREWYKFSQFRDTSFQPRDLLINPTAAEEDFIDVLRGDLDSVDLGAGADVGLAGNGRKHLSQGIQSTYEDFWDTSTGSYSLESGLRYHFDSIDTDHVLDYYQMENGRLKASSDPSDRGIITDNVLKKANAFTLHTILHGDYGKWVVTGLMRAEHVGFSYLDQSTDVRRAHTDSAFVPGVGLLRKITPNLSVRSSINQAVTLAGLASDGTEDKEESTNYELGVSYHPTRFQTHIDATLFYNDYSNLTGTCTASTGCLAESLGDQYSGGAAEVLGLEGRLGHGFQVGELWLPMYLNLTLLKAQFTDGFLSNSPDWGRNLFVKAGDPLPYVPQVKYSFQMGAEYKGLNQNLEFSYHGQVYDQSAQEERQVVPAYTVLDWSLGYQIAKRYSLLFKVENLLDNRYAVSYKPYGLRPGKPRLFLIGATFEL